MTPPPADPWFRPHTAYVHVPFCAHHCGYCDFAVTTAAGPLVELYLDALAAALAGLGDPFPVETRFIGGGTPTRLTPDQLARLLALLTRWLPAPPGSEFSIEANPDDVTPELVAVLAAGGPDLDLPVNELLARYSASFLDQGVSHRPQPNGQAPRARR